MKTQEKSFLKKSLLLLITAIVCIAISPLTATAITSQCTDSTVAIYRAYNTSNTDHFYTRVASEIDPAWQMEGTAFYAMENSHISNSVPVYRLWNGDAVGDHFYTTSDTERDNAVATLGYTYEGVGFHAFNTQVAGSVPVYRLYNSVIFDHFYTTSITEKNNAINTLGYTDEGVAFYAFNNQTSINNGTCVTPAPTPTPAPAPQPTCYATAPVVNCPTGTTVSWTNVKVADTKGTQQAIPVGVIFDRANFNVQVQPGDKVFMTGYAVGTQSPACHSTDDALDLFTSQNVQLIEVYNNMACNQVAVRPEPVDVTSEFLKNVTGSKNVTANINFRDVCGDVTSHTPYYINVARCVPNTPVPPTEICTPNFSQRCQGSVIYNYDSCGNRGTIVQNCNSSELCQNSNNLPVWLISSGVTARCVPSACSADSDCQPNGWWGATTCQNNNVYQNWTLQTCSNPGTASSRCVATQTLNPKLKTTCTQNQTCNASSGTCIDNTPAPTGNCYPSAPVVTCAGGVSPTWTNVKVTDNFANQYITGSGQTFDSANANVQVQSGDKVFLTAYAVGSQTPVCHYTDDALDISTSLNKQLTKNYFVPGCTDAIRPTDPLDVTYQFTNGIGGSNNVSSSFTFRDVCGSNISHTPYYLNVAHCAPVVTPTYQCNDGIDNDADGKIDYPQDPGCTSSTDNDEFNVASIPTLLASCVGSPNPTTPNQTVTFNPTAVSGGIGNYQYRWTAGCVGNLQSCTNSYTTSGNYAAVLRVTSGTQWVDTTCSVIVNATITTPQCSDGIDNDSDGAIDYPNDFSCGSATDNDETNPKAQCQDGVDNDADGLTDYPQDPGCSSKQDNNEFNATTTPTLVASCTTSASTVNANQSVTFNGSATGGTGNYTYQWSAGCNAFTQNCSNTFATGGSYTGLFKVTSGTGATMQTQYASCTVAVNSTAITPICSTNSQCGTNAFVGDSFCNGNGVYRNFKTFTCNNAGSATASCSDSTAPQLQSTCTGNQTCSGAGVCGNVNIVCSSNSQCGGSGYTGSGYCNGNTIWQNYTTNTCINAGTTSSFCSPSTSPQQVQTCGYNQTCSAGNCINTYIPPVNTCISHSYQQCLNGSVHWFNSCGNDEGISQYCTGNQTCSGNTCVNQFQGQGYIQMTETVRNLSSGITNYSNSVNAAPGNIIQYNIVITTSGNQNVNNLTIRDTLPANLIYNNNLTLDGVSNSGNIMNGLYVGSLYSGQTRTITFQAQVAGAGNFVFGTTTLTDAVYANSTDGTSNSANTSASVIVTKSGVLGATSISTGPLTGNFWLDSFLAPLALGVAGFWGWKSGFLGNFAFTGFMQNRRKSRFEEKIDPNVKYF